MHACMRVWALLPQACSTLVQRTSEQMQGLPPTCHLARSHFQDAHDIPKAGMLFGFTFGYQHNGVGLLLGTLTLCRPSLVYAKNLEERRTAMCMPTLAKRKAVMLGIALLQVGSGDELALQVAGMYI